MNCTCMSLMFSFCRPLDAGVLRSKSVRDTFRTGLLHRCWISTVALLETQGSAGLGLGRSPSSHAQSPGLVLWIPGSRHFTSVMSGTIPLSGSRDAGFLSSLRSWLTVLWSAYFLKIWIVYIPYYLNPILHLHQGAFGGGLQVMFSSSLMLFPDLWLAPAPPYWLEQKSFSVLRPCSLCLI